MVFYELELELELELIQTRMIQKPLLWVEVGKSACVRVGICELRLSLPARYDPQCPSLLDFLSGCLVRVLWIVGGRSWCACGAQKVRVCWGGVGRRRCRVPFLLLGFRRALCCLGMFCVAILEHLFFLAYK